MKNYLLITIITFVIFNSTFLFSTNYYVDKQNGSDSNNGLNPANAWETIAKVNSFSFSPGDSILFKRNCVWTGQELILNNGGTHGNRIIISDYGTGNAPVFNGNDLKTSINLNNKSYINIENIHFKHGNARNISGWDCHNITIDNCVFDTAQHQNLYMMGDTFLIKNSVFRYSKVEHGIYLEAHPSGAYSVIVENNFFDENGGTTPNGNGIQFNTTWNSTIHNAIIRNNIIHSANAYGINILDGDSTLIYNNVIYSVGGVPINFGHDGDGLAPQNGMVYNNTIFCPTGSWGPAVSVEEATSGGHIVKNNIFHMDNGTWGYMVESQNSNINFDHNLWYSSDNNYVFQVAGTIYNSFNAWKNTANQGSNSIIGDPLFTNMSTDDYHITSGSPAIDAGISIPGIQYDIDGNLRGASFDMGAYEYQGATPPDVTNPTVPVSLTANAVSSSQINLTWTASSDNIGVTGYKIYRCTGSSCTPIAQIDTSTTNSYMDTGLTPNTPYTYSVAAYDAAGNNSAKSTSATDTTFDVSCKLSSTSWQGWLITSQSGTFTCSFDATPLGNGIDGLIGLSNGLSTAYSDLAVTVRFSSVTGNIDARNGANYQAVSTIPFVANTTYHFRIVVDVTTHTFSAYVTPQGGSELTIGTNYAFRNGQTGISNLDYWNIIGDIGQHIACNFNITSSCTTPTAPSIGTLTQPDCSSATGSVVLNNLPSSGTWTLTRTPGGITTNGTGTSTTISGLATGTYTYTVTNTSGCASAASANVVINTQPSTPPAPIVGTITQPDCSASTGSVILTSLPSSGTWTLTRTPGGTTTNGTGTSKTITGLASGTYTFTVTNTAGCTSPASANVVINAQPTTPTAPTVGTITQPDCSTSTGSVMLTSLPSSGTWTLTRTPGGITTNGTGTSTTISGLATGTYTYTVTNTSGCTSAASANVVINAQPTIPAAPSIGTLTQPDCSSATGSVVLNNLPSSGTWTLTRTPGGTTTNGTGTSKTITGLASGTYTFTVTNTAGCTSPPSANVVINAQPTTPTAPTVGTITQPDCSTSTGSVMLTSLPSSGTWTLTRTPGGTTTNGTGTSKTIAGLVSGTYTFTVTNTAGCTSPPSANVVINNQPTTPATPIITQNGNVLTSSAPTGNQWYLNGIPITGEINQTYTVTQNGTYTVIVSINGCSSAPSSPLIISTVGIETLQNKPFITVYPNPFNISFTLKIPETTILNNSIIKIYDVLGKEVRVVSINNHQTIIEKGDLQKGIYFLTIINNGEIFQRETIVAH